MAKRRNRTISVEQTADLGILEHNPPQEIFRRRLELRRRLSVALLALLTVVLLTVSFAPFDCWYLAYFALVPWVLALDAGTGRKWALLWGWLAGVVFWAANLYWLWWITLPGYAALVLYLSAYWFVAAALTRSATKRNCPMWIVLPVVWVALEFARAYVIGGFPWFYLAHSQYAQTRLIQIADTTGQYGVSFFVAMVNGAIVDMLASPLFVRSRLGGKIGKRILVGIGVSILACAAMLFYGVWRVGQDTCKPGPVIGIVQESFPITLNGQEASPEKIFDDHRRACDKFIGHNCDLVIWPETMLPRAINAEMLDVKLDKLVGDDLRALADRFFAGSVKLSDYSNEEILSALTNIIEGSGESGTKNGCRRFYAGQMGELSKALGCPILAGGSSIHRNALAADPRDKWEVRNSALWFDGSWRNSAIYSKMHLVPLSEYVPFKDSWRGLHDLLRSFVPQSMDQLAPGKSTRPFELNRGGKTWHIASPICYEGTFARICRKLVMADGKKQADIIVNLSNDGWFVYKWKNVYRASTEQSQHLASYCFRAIENRVPVVRAVNTGISASITSNGKIETAVEFRQGDFVKRTMISGTLLLNGEPTGSKEYVPGRGPRVLVDSRVSVYSLVGDVFALVVSGAALALAAVLILFKRKRTDLGAA